MKTKCFSTKLYDILIPTKLNSEEKGKFDSVFLVMEYVPMNLSNMFEKIKADTFSE